VFCSFLGSPGKGGRLGYRAWFYDRWLQENRPALAIGLAWDCQLDETIPLEPHDQPLDLIVTPTRIHGPFR